MRKTSSLLFAVCALGAPLFAVLPACAGNPPLGVAAVPAVAAPLPDTLRHTFIYVPEGTVSSVAVAGSFNNWDKTATPLVRDADGKTWRVTLPLAYGKHTYKFVVDNEKWVPDPTAATVDDGNGNVNSLLTVLPADYADPARADDGVLAASALEHRQVAPFLNYDRGNLTLSLRLRPGDARSVEAVVGSGGAVRTVAMHPAAQDELYTRYTTQIPWDRKTDLVYSFRITDGDRVFSFDRVGLEKPGAAAQPFRLEAKDFQPFVVPGWVEKSVFYQIFPDRYDNGDRRNDPPDVQPWDARTTYGNRFGGDAAGVRKHVDYLQSLGISAVYFNPVFQSPSNHRYDAEDYRRIDPQFGTNEEFIGLTNALKQHGIRTVMDFVFNHTATTYPAFQDVLKNGAASPYKDWYFVRSYPVRVSDTPNYAAWSGFSSMPKLNVMNPPTHDYLLGVLDYWKARVPLAGIRLDVASEVDPRFWRDLRSRGKKLDPNLWIVGEVWGDGSPWLGGDQWDSVMNYPFRDACLRFVAEGKSTPTQFMARLMAIHESYAPQVSRNMMNLLSSHDTPRFLTACGNDADLQRLAATVQFTWVGAPSVYYGEEIGMQGGIDPDNRRGMEWKRATPDNPMLAFYRRLIRVRNGSPALQSGDPRVLLTDDAAGTLAYSRTLGKDVVIVALNRSREPRTVTIPVPELTGTWTDALTDTTAAAIQEGKLTVTLPPLRAVVLRNAPLSP